MRSKVTKQVCTCICMAVHTCVLCAMHGDGECGRDEGRRASGGSEDGGGEGRGREGGGWRESGAAKQGGKLSSVPISAHHVNSRTRVVSTSAIYWCERRDFISIRPVMNCASHLCISYPI